MPSKMKLLLLLAIVAVCVAQDGPDFFVEHESTHYSGDIQTFAKDDVIGIRFTDELLENLGSTPLTEDFRKQDALTFVLFPFYLICG